MNAPFNPHAEAVDAAAEAARNASRTLAHTPAETRDRALQEAAAALRRHALAIAEANAADLAESKATSAFRDRLTLTPARIEAMAQGVQDIAALPDPLSRTLAEWTRPNGLHIRRVAAPIGVIGMIYEARPNVGADGRRHLREVRQRRHPARRVGECRTPPRAINAAFIEGLRNAGLPETPGADRTHHRPRLRRRHAGRRRQDRPDHSARRKIPGQTRAG